MQKSKIKNFIYLLFGIGFILLPTMTLAAELKLSSPVSKIEAGQQLQVGLLLNTGEENINALEGKIIFPQELLKLKEIRDGNTIINLWLEKPKNYSTDSIIFSGITPGGFKGENGLIFLAIFETIKSGIATLKISDARVLLNDGQGSSAALNILPVKINILETTSSQKRIAIEVSDTLSPESFKPEIVQDRNLFDGKYFLVFATQDKGSGMDIYKARESRQKFFSFLTKWQEATSPYFLTDQELKSYIYIKAVDKRGNGRIAVVEPRYPLNWYENWRIGSIIILIIVFGYILWEIMKSKIRSTKS